MKLISQFRIIVFVLIALAQIHLTRCVADEANSPKADPDLIVKRGLSAEVFFSHENSQLVAMAEQTSESDVLVRLERMDQDDSGFEPPFQYKVQFFGAQAGDYDLSNWISLEDGSKPVTGGQVPSMWVRIVSDLPPEKGTSLYEIADPALYSPSGYRRIAFALGTIWLLTPLVLLFLNRREKFEPPAQIVTPPLTLTDRLRPLIESAHRGSLTTEQKGQMELLLYVFWQQRLKLPGSLTQSIPLMRSDKTAGHLLRTLEAWVHCRPDRRPVLDESTLQALLEPYHEKVTSPSKQQGKQDASVSVEHSSVSEAVK